MGAINHVDIAIDNDRGAMVQAGQRLRDPIRSGLVIDLTESHQEVSGGYGIGMHRLAIGPGRKSDLRDVAPRHPILEQRPNRIAVAQSIRRVAHVQMGIEGNQSDLVDRNPKRLGEAMDAGAGDGIVATDQESELVPVGGCGDRLADRSGGMLDRQAFNFGIAMIGNARLQFAPGPDVIAPDPLQRRPK